MGEKTTCPVCDSHTSDIYYRFSREENCPECDVSFNTVNEINEIRSKKQKLKRLKIEREVIEESTSLKERLILLEERERKATGKLEHVLFNLREMLEDLEIYIDKLRCQ